MLRPRPGTSLVLVLFLALLGCKRSDPAGPLRMGFFPNLTHAQALVGNAEGLFAREVGKRVQATQFNAGPAAMEALLGGTLDVCYVGSGPALTAASRSPGALVVIAGAASGGAGLWSRTVKTARHLIGKQVGTPQLGNTQDVALRYWLKEQGIPFSDEEKKGSVRIRPLPNPDLLALLQKGQLAAAWVPEPWGARMHAQAGATLILDEATLWPGGRFPTTILVASREALKTRRKDVLAFLRAHLALTTRAQSDPAAFAVQANEAFASLTQHPLPQAVLQEAMGRLELTTDPLQPQLAEAARHAVALGFVPATDLSGLVDLSLLRELGAAPTAGVP